MPQVPWQVFITRRPVISSMRSASTLIAIVAKPCPTPISSVQKKRLSVSHASAPIAQASAVSGIAISGDEPRAELLDRRRARAGR